MSRRVPMVNLGLVLSVVLLLMAVGMTYTPTVMAVQVHAPVVAR